MREQLKNVLFIVDVKNWAFDNIAEYLSKILKDNYNIYILYTEDYSNPGALLKKIGEFDRLDFVHFFYRGYLQILIESIATGSVDDALADKFLNIAIVTSVPD